MSIEIKELVVKTTVDNELSGGSGSGTGTDPCCSIEKIKAQIIAECREMFDEYLIEQRER